MYRRILDLGRSRSYHWVVALISLVYCIVLPGSVIEWLSEHFYAELFAVILLSIDSLIRYQAFGNVSLLSSIDYAMCAISVNLLIFELVFQSFVLVRLTTVLSFACAMRAIIAVQHSIVFNDALSPVFRKLVVSDIGQLDICYVTSRIIVISKISLSTEESRFLEDRHSSLLKSLAVPYTNEILSLSALSSIVDSAIRHLFSNTAHLVSINAPLGDSTPILVVCCLLIRTGAASSVSRAIQLYMNQMYLVSPLIENLLCKSQISQMHLFACTTPVMNFPMILRRVCLSQFDATKFPNLRITIVDIDTGGNVLAREISPSSSSCTSVTFNLPDPLPIGKDTFVIFSDNTSFRLFALYMNSEYHLVRLLASSTGVYHYVASIDDCDHYRPTTKGMGARIEIVAQVRNEDEFLFSKKDLDPEFLTLPILARTLNV